MTQPLSAVADKERALMRPSWVCVCATTVVVLTLSCGICVSIHAQAATPLAKRADPCKVITQAEAKTALGKPVTDPVHEASAVPDGAACAFYGPSVPGAPPAATSSVRVMVASGPTARKSFEEYRAKVQAVPVAGIGEQAYYDGTISLSVLKGSVFMRIAVIGVKDHLAAERVLAAKALKRL